MHEVLVTGLGMLSPSGLSVADSCSAWLRGESAVRWAPAAIREFVPHALAAMVPDGWQARLERAHQSSDRAVQLATVAAADAIADAELDLPGGIDTTRFGVYVGIGMGGASTLESLYGTFYERLYRPESSGGRNPAMVHPLSVPRLMTNAAAAALSIRYGLRGPTITYSVACASSALALGEACRAIRHGWIDRALVVGCEAMITTGAYLIWNALRVMAQVDPEDPARSCKPFDAERSGFVLGEGAAALVLENAAVAHKSARTAYAAVTGYGSSSDADHLTAPSVEGQARSMRAALDDAGIEAGQIGYINAHGTATTAGDAAETASIVEVFGEHAARLPVSATKSMHGHLIGAAGALEFVGTVWSIKHGVVPPTAHWRTRDAQCHLDYVAEGARRLPDLTWAMSNSFAFGGTNVSLIARRVD